MRFTRAKAEASIPAVPDDSAERLGALARSTDELRELQNATPKVEDMAESVRGHLHRNHFIERLELSYGITREAH